MRTYRNVAAALGLIVLLLGTTAGCKSTASGESSNTGVLTGYEFGNTDAYWEQRRDRPGYREFD